jgi:hypothetical protein
VSGDARDVCPRVWISITKNAYRRLRNTVSTWKKPEARIPDA